MVKLNKDKKYWRSKYNNVLSSINFYNKWVLDSMGDTTGSDDFLLELDEWENEHTILVGKIVLELINEQKYNGQKIL